MLASILMIVGYSINDTIVVFDRMGGTGTQPGNQPAKDRSSGNQPGALSIHSYQLYHPIGRNLIVDLWCRDHQRLRFCLCHWYFDWNFFLYLYRKSNFLLLAPRGPQACGRRGIVAQVRLADIQIALLLRIIF